jgi:hypothetical protein
MTVVVDGTSGITTNSGTVVSTTDATLNGLTVGKGGGAVSNNNAIGTNALAGSNSGAGYNTAVGNSAGFTNTTGAGNLFVGYQAGNKNTTGSGNSFVGGLNSLGAGYNNTTGGNNTAFGSDALAGNTTASGSTAVGYQSLYSNTVSYNTAVGYQVLYANTTGQYNTAIGGPDAGNVVAALRFNTTGSYNTALGNGALGSNSTASNNTAVGYRAGYSTTTGIYNTMIGNQAGYSLTTGTGNTFVGSNYPAGYFITTGNYNTILGGYNGNQGGLDIRTASNYIVLSDGDGNPSAIRDSSDAWYFGLGTGSSSGVVTLQGVAANNNGPLFVGATGAKNASTNQWFIGSNSQIKGGTTYSTLTCSAGGLTGGVNLTSGSTAWASASDARLKNVTGTYTTALADIAQIQPVKFTWKDDIANTPCVGVIAQSVQAVVPEAIDSLRHSKEDETDYLGVRYTELIPLMIASIQELKTIVDAQAAEIAELKAKVA